MTQKLLSTPVEGTVELLRDIMLRVAVMDGFLQNTPEVQLFVEADF